MKFIVLMNYSKSVTPNFCLVILEWHTQSKTQTHRRKKLKTHCKYVDICGYWLADDMNEEYYF